LDPPEAARAVREALESGVRASLEADAPLGIFLSGGLDSTAIAAMASATGARLPSFTLTFDGDARVERDSSRLVISDDEPYARSAAAGLDLPLREAHLSCADIAAELKAVARVDDALPAWEQELSQRTLARVASRSVKGVLVGDAADETHYGYHFLLDEEATQHPSVILRRLGAVPIRRDVDPDPVGSCSREYTALAEEAGATFGPGEGGLTAMTHLIVRRWLPRLLHNGDIHCMAFGLEPRVPFCSSSLVELAQRVSAPDATARGVEKSILREALRGVVPEDVRLRKKSALPKHQRVDEVYRREAAAVARDPHALVHALVDVERLAPLLTKPRLTEPERAQLFRVICLHHWASSWEVQPP
jgi:asparagine synthase (glutamine-hydrolysing)